MYSVLVWQRVMGMVSVMCGEVLNYYRYCVCTVWWCGSLLYVWFVYCVVVWQGVIGMVPLLCGGVAACYKYVA